MVEEFAHVVRQYAEETKIRSQGEQWQEILLRFIYSLALFAYVKPMQTGHNVYFPPSGLTVMQGVVMRRI